MKCLRHLTQPLRRLTPQQIWLLILTYATLREPYAPLRTSAYAKSLTPPYASLRTQAFWDELMPLSLRQLTPPLRTLTPEQTRTKKTKFRRPYKSLRILTQPLRIFTEEGFCNESYIHTYMFTY